MTITRRTVLHTTATLGTVLPLVNILPARGAQFTLKLGHAQTATHPMNIRQQEAASKIKAATDGRVEVRVFPNSQLGSEPDMLAQVRTGALDMVATSVLYLETLNPAVNLSGLGYTFKNIDEVWNAWDHDFGDHIRQQFAAAGLTVFEKTYNNGFRVITSSVRPIHSPNDLHNLKIRLPSIRVQQSLFVHLGAAPTSVNIKEAYSALQTHLADAQENPLTHIELFKFYEVQKYCSMTNHMWDGFWIIGSPPNLGALPDDLQRVVHQQFNDAALLQRNDMATLTPKLRDRLTNQGLVFNDPPFAPFRETLQKSGFYSEWRRQTPPKAWELLQAITGPLD